MADGINLGLTRMSEACRETTWRQLSWTADWHVREECYAQARAGLIDAQHRQPLAAHWGTGTTSLLGGLDRLTVQDDHRRAEQAAAAQARLLMKRPLQFGQDARIFPGTKVMVNGARARELAG